MITLEVPVSAVKWHHETIEAVKYEEVYTVLDFRMQAWTQLSSEKELEAERNSIYCTHITYSSHGEESAESTQSKSIRLEYR